MTNKRYKLIQTYPYSGPVGTIFEWDENQEIFTSTSSQEAYVDQCEIDDVRYFEPIIGPPTKEEFNDLIFYLNGFDADFSQAEIIEKLKQLINRM